MRPSRFLADLPDQLVDRQVTLANLVSSSVLGDDESGEEQEVGGRKIDMTAILSRAQANMEKARDRQRQEIAKQTEEAKARPASNREERRREREAKAAPESKRERSAATAPAADASGTEYKSGDRVRHRTFGEGLVVQVRGSGVDLELVVAFAGKGVKTLLADVAPIEKV
jgi:FKBP-type peptidyl-prolyl cis-trans isomerase